MDMLFRVKIVTMANISQQNIGASKACSKLSLVPSFLESSTTQIVNATAPPLVAKHSQRVTNNSSFYLVLLQKDAKAPKNRRNYPKATIHSIQSPIQTGHSTAIQSHSKILSTLSPTIVTVNSRTILPTKRKDALKQYHSFTGRP